MQSMVQARASLRRSPTEQAIAHILVPALCLTTFCICALPQMGMVPAWVVFIVNMALTVRISALSHELVHERSANVDRNPLIRLNLHIYTPLSLGFAELRKLHLLHHRHLNSDGDPDYPMIKGGRLRSLLGLAFMPEHWFFYALKHRLISADFWRLWAVRCAILAVFIYVVGLEAYLAFYLLPVKIATAVLYLVFSYDAHTDDDGRRRGSYNISPKWVVPALLARPLVGQVACNASYYHATHHRYPWISANRLHRATEQLQEAERLSVRERLV